MSQQICASCATANSTFASVCRSCSAPLEPRSLPSDTSGGFAIYGADGQAAVQAAPASTPPTDYASAPHSASGGNGHWPAERLTPSTLQKWASDGWTGLPRAQTPLPVRPASRSWAAPPPAPPGCDGGTAAAVPPPPPAAPPDVPAAPRGPLAFHLEVGAGSALAAGTPAGFAPEPPPAGAADDGGGHGWGVREQKPAPSSAWDVQPATYTPPAPYLPPGARPASGSPPAAAWARSGRRPRVGVQIFFLSVIAVVITAGIFIYLMNGLATGVGSGTHTLTNPLTLGGVAPNTNPELTAAGNALESEIEAHAVAANSGLEQTVVGFYGSSDGIADGIQPDYFLFLESVNTSLTASDLSQVDSHLLTVISVQTADRVSFHCGAPLSGEMTSMCTWVDGNVFGVVEGSASVGAAATTAAAEQARTIAEH
ncbi:MAG TPA: hypothetical protein DCX12_05915 [Chloroflexi bacterium]|nr:hypothetical protein [Chloroflexota bacterium]